jgi:hypothetical protein
MSYNPPTRSPWQGTQNRDLSVFQNCEALLPHLRVEGIAFYPVSKTMSLVDDFKLTYLRRRLYHAS